MAVDNVQVLGNIQAPSDASSSEGEDVFSTYGVVQDIGPNGEVKSPPKYYVERFVDPTLDNTKEWVEVTNQDDLTFLDNKAKSQGLVTLAEGETRPGVSTSDNDKPDDAFRTGASTNHPLITQAPVGMVDNAAAQGGAIGGPDIIQPTKRGAVIGDATALRWPRDFGVTGDTDYVSFQFFNYVPPFNPRGGNRNNRSQGLKKLDTGKLGAQYARYGQSIHDDNLFLEKADNTFFKDIILYMPEDNGGQYGANWSGKGFGNVMVEVMNTMGSSGGLDYGSYERSINSMTGAFKKMGYDAIAKLANDGFGQNVAAQDIMSGVSGTILNPNTEMMYQAPEMRGFNIRFKMQARSPDESKEIKRICTVFKRAILPSYGGRILNKEFSDEVGSFLTVPKVVKVAFMTGNELNEYVTQYKPCAITALDINHTPDGAWAAYEGGAPVATEIRITFKELKLIFADEINDGASY